MTALPNRDRRAERKEATRQEILEAAWVIARRDGLTAITLREIGQRVGMQPPSLYSHFSSKNAIYDAMFAASWSELMDTFSARGPLPARPGPITEETAMTTTTGQQAELRRSALPRDVAMTLAETEYGRCLDVLRSLARSSGRDFFVRGTGGPEIELDAVEFCRARAGGGPARHPGPVLTAGRQSSEPSAWA